ncbi:MAG: sigma 54-interacting transcriptional regulator [Polyangiales bacterium]
MTRTIDEATVDGLEAALDAVVGAALVLDAELRVIAATPSASAMVGVPVERGTLAPKLLCGESTQRPLAEALAAGRPIRTELLRPGANGRNHVVHVSATPIGRGEKARYSLVLLETEAWESESPDAPVEVHGILTRDRAMKKLLRDVERVGRSDVTVLVRGETGTGKELVARAIHDASRRAKGPFHAINCAALPAPLLESQLFGHVRGAFTGAVRDEPGHFRLAHGGTLFLDEVGELGLELQAKLLRVLQQKEVIPVGGQKPIPIDVRIVAATHRSLREAVEAGDFRADLMYRLRVVPLYLPPLRERLDDIPLLAERFLAQHPAEDGTLRHLAPSAIARLLAHDFPGNVRELQNAMEYACALSDGPVVTEADLPPEFRAEGEQEPGGANTPRSPAHLEGRDLPDEARRLVFALERAAGHRGRAARSLGMSRVTLWRKLKQYGLLAEEADEEPPTRSSTTGQLR